MMSCLLQDKCSVLKYDMKDILRRLDPLQHYARIRSCWHFHSREHHDRSCMSGHYMNQGCDCNTSDRSHSSWYHWLSQVAVVILLMQKRPSSVNSLAILYSGSLHTLDSCLSNHIAGNSDTMIISFPMVLWYAGFHGNNNMQSLVLHLPSSCPILSHLIYLSCDAED